DHGFERHPVLVPAPRVELGMAARAQADVRVAPDKAQQKPDLLLALVRAAPLALHPMGGHVVVQPFPRTPEDPDVLRLEACLLVELPQPRLPGRLPRADAALAGLPGLLHDALAPAD